ncbi:conserved hypothetical protein [Coccidioides posadasii str. Silveira]|uniref:Uncharacterized protein n=1 Tax=Coccidioides posadasii (strain RMSCC 757 / Silveira) TaxID=443226 RepID=E9D749_COCPS|nr:conserved hypothetical protein [Coccidioides posadasii str. Silveira]
MANKYLSAVMDTEEEHKSLKQHYLRYLSQNMFLILLLKDLLLLWVREWANSILGDSENCLKLNLFIDHGDLTPTKIGNLGHMFIQTIQHAILRQHDLNLQQCYQHMFLIISDSLFSYIMISLYDIQKQDAQQLQWQFQEINSVTGKQDYAPVI